MSAIWDKMCEVFTLLVRPTRRKTRVTFSPSTLHREIIRHTKLSASTNPFFNFLAEVRMKANGGQLMHPGCGSMSARESARIAKTAGRLWNSMTDEQKQPYRSIAMEQRKLKRLRRRRSNLTARRRRTPLHCKTPVECKFILPPQPTHEGDL
uniref:High mobility group B protein 4 n=1 Tax=Zeugodacus cucurbitae TaxID=28588 RepID=A0A0A1WLV9_ZEUCU